MNTLAKNRTARMGLTSKRARIYRVQDDRTGCYPWRASVSVVLLFLASQSAYSASQRSDRRETISSEVDRREPATAREFYNEGTRYFAQTNLWRAEYNLERALALQDERLQPAALYNLGHIRFTEGADELKKGPPGKKTAGVGNAVLNEADE